MPCQILQEGRLNGCLHCVRGQVHEGLAGAHACCQLLRHAGCPSAQSGLAGPRQQVLQGGREQPPEPPHLTAVPDQCTCSSMDCPCRHLSRYQQGFHLCAQDDARSLRAQCYAACCCHTHCYKGQENIVCEGKTACQSHLLSCLALQGPGQLLGGSVECAPLHCPKSRQHHPQLLESQRYRWSVDQSMSPAQEHQLASPICRNTVDDSGKQACAIGWRLFIPFLSIEKGGPTCGVIEIGESQGQRVDKVAFSNFADLIYV